MVEREPKIFEQTIPFIGYVQFLFEGDMANNRRVTEFWAKGAYTLSGLQVDFDLIMPTPIFKPKSKEALFNSELPESYDGFDFMMSERLDIYAETIGMEPRMIRNDWLKLYAIWHKDQGSAVFMNIMHHTIKLLATCKPNTAIHMDASSFCRSPQFTYWCKVGGRKPDEVRAWITDETMNRIKMMPEAKTA